MVTNVTTKSWTRVESRGGSTVSSLCVMLRFSIDDFQYPIAAFLARQVRLATEKQRPVAKVQDSNDSLAFKSR
jgi:hypothetical protein